MYVYNVKIVNHTKFIYARTYPKKNKKKSSWTQNLFEMKCLKNSHYSNNYENHLKSWLIGESMEMKDT